jgi:hypothetical protein
MEREHAPQQSTPKMPTSPTSVTHGSINPNKITLLLKVSIVGIVVGFIGMAFVFAGEHSEPFSTATLLASSVFGFIESISILLFLVSCAILAFKKAFSPMEQSVNTHQNETTQSSATITQVNKVTSSTYVRIGAIISLVVGALVWILSPMLGGANEPWDATNGYGAVIVLSGFISGVLGGWKYGWSWAFISIIGQIIGSFIVALQVGGDTLASAPVGLITIPMFTFVYVYFGAFLGVIITSFFKKLRHA